MASQSPNPKETVVVTGGSGFLGQHIVKHLLEQTEFSIREVRVFDVLPLNWHHGLEAKQDTGILITQCLGDLSKLKDVQSAFKGASVVIHNASIVDVTSMPDIEKIHRVNVTGTEHVIKASIENNVKCLIYTSSASAVNKLGYYGTCKNEAEHLVLKANDQQLSNGKRISTCALRLPGMYGEGGTDVLGSLKRNIIGDTFIRYGDENSKFQAAYAGNMAWAFVSTLRQLLAATSERVSDLAPNPAGQAIGVTDDTPLSSYCGALDPFLQFFNLKPLRFPIPFFILYIIASICEWFSFLLQPVCTMKLPLSKVAVDHMHCLPVFTRDDAKHYLNYQPIYSYDESIKRTIVYLKKQLLIY